ncbi:MAG: efflux RND transporter permease subunit [Phycisphaerales bacterium]
MFSKFFIHRPIFACVVSILVILLGAVAYTRLPVEQYPELAPPIVRVEAFYPGASARTIADTVAAPIEQQVNGVEQMIYMQSTSSDGRYSLDVSFETGADIDLAAVLVQNRVSVAVNKLPEEVRRQGVTTKKQSTAMVGVIAISSPDRRYDDIFLSNFVTIRLVDEFARLYGVGGSAIFPAKEYGMRVWLDTDKLKARNLTVTDVNNAIREQNVQVAAGVVGRQPAPAGTDFELTVNTLGRLSDPEQFADIIIKREEGGRVVRVRDVARVELGARDYTTMARFNGLPAAVMPIYQLPGANLMATAQAVEKKLEELKKDFPEGLEGKLFYDSSMFIKSSMKEVQHTILEAFVLVFLVVLVFLQNFRATIIPTLAIPASLIGTFLFMAVLGFSINMLTLFGLVLAIGIVVDDAIIVVENVERVLAESHGKLTVVQATEKAMGEIFGPVIAITLVLMCVFIPTAALPGITGEMYRQFALTIAASTALSGINALTLSPALCALLLKPHDHDKKHGPVGRLLRLPATLFNKSFDFASRVYAGFARISCKAAILTLIGFGATIAFTVHMYQRVPTGFVPEEDLGFVIVAAQLPDGASLERSQAVIDRASEIIQEVEGVQDVTTLGGFSVLDGQGVTFANAWVVLEPWDVRTEKKRGIREIVGEIQRGVAPIQEASFLVFSIPAISGLGNASGFEMKLLDRASVGRATMEQAANEVIGAAFAQSKIAYAFTSFRDGVPQVFADIDREKALKMDVPLSSIFQTLQTALGGAYVNDFNAFGRTFQVNTQAESRFRLAAEDIRKLEVRNKAGQMLPLGSLVTIRDDQGPERVVRFNMYEAATVNGVPAPGASSGEAMAVMEGIAADKLPQGMGYSWFAMSYQEKMTAGQGSIIFLLAIILVYLILAAQYESWTAPLSVILSIPLVVLGALLALTWAGLDNNVFTQIGLVLLVGLGAKNAILIVEFARQNRQQGKAIIDSAVEAARQRLRPILMTSFAFILGVLPLTLATGAGAAGRRSLGTAVMGGMIGVTILGLFFTPALYVTVTWIAEKLGGKPKPPTPGTPSDASAQSVLATSSAKAH